MIQQREDAQPAPTGPGQRIRLARAASFVAIVIAATWGIHALTEGRAGAEPGLPVGMFVPAVVAIGFRLFLVPDGPLRRGTLPPSVRLMLRAYLALFLLALGLEIARARGAPALLTQIGGAGMVLWTLLLMHLFRKRGSAEFEACGLGLGNMRTGRTLALGYVLFLLLQSGANLVAGLAELRSRQPFLGSGLVPDSLYPVAVAVTLFIAIAGTPLASLAVMFGEEYGWRGYLLDELRGLGALPAAVLVGGVWWLWHFPILESGIHTYPPTPTGYGMALAFFVLWGVVQGYAVLKTGSIWIAAFLHGLFNSVYSFGLTYLARPSEKLQAFGLGWPGLVCMAVVVAVLLRDPVWRSGRRGKAVASVA